MADTIKVNFALEPDTVAMLEQIAKETHRGKSNVIDWLVSSKFNQMRLDQSSSVGDPEPKSEG
jgi:hypothetical protein